MSSHHPPSLMTCRPLQGALGSGPCWYLPTMLRVCSAQERPILA